MVESLRQKGLNEYSTTPQLVRLEHEAKLQRLYIRPWLAVSLNYLSAGPCPVFKANLKAREIWQHIHFIPLFK